MLSKIRSRSGQSLYADKFTTQASRITFARILVKMNVTKELLKEVKIQGARGKVFKQTVVYEWKPIFCQKCLQVGHICGEKAKEPALRKQENGMGKEWKATTNKHVVAKKEKTRVEEVQEAENKQKEQQPNEWQLVKSKSARKVKQ